ncbi:MAG: hypothetical protein HDT25_05950 [Ruminococcus sp.]|nr:hypothetical protein [Ruminococcus sp.]
MALALAFLAKSALAAVIAPFVDEARTVALNTAQDVIRSKLAGRMSVEEWSDAIIKSVDKVKERAVEEENLRYIGGKLKYALSANAPDMVTISFQLYFQDEFNKWRKAEAESDVPEAKFTLDALDELKENGEIIFDVE